MRCRRSRPTASWDLCGQPELTTVAGWQRLIARLRTHDWVVYAQRPFAEPHHLIRYLGRYINRIAIANHRILSIDDGVIAFTYLDNREKAENGEKVEKIKRLSADEFIRRFLAHIPPPQVRSALYYGFLANGQRKEKLTHCRVLLLGLEDPERPYIDDLEAFLARQAIRVSGRGCHFGNSINS